LYVFANCEIRPRLRRQAATSDPLKCIHFFIGNWGKLFSTADDVEQSGGAENERFVAGVESTEDVSGK